MSDTGCTPVTVLSEHAPCLEEQDGCLAAHAGHVLLDRHVQYGCCAYLCFECCHDILETQGAAAAMTLLLCTHLKLHEAMAVCCKMASMAGNA